MNVFGYTEVMVTQLEFLRSLILAHYRGDEGAFRTAAWEIVENEKRVNRTVAASELERLLRDANVSPPTRRDTLHQMHGLNGTSPKDKEKNAFLLETLEPKREIDDLILSPKTRGALDRVVTEWRKTEILKAHGLEPVKRILFHGPPGCGKSVAAEALARALYLPLATVKFDAVVSSYLGETASNLRKVFDYGRSRPIVLFFDEFDAIGKERTAWDEHGELKRVVNSFLQLLDGFRADSLTIAATNHEGLLDPALWRRFDEVVVFPLPTQSEIESLFARHFRQIPLSHGVRLKDIVRTLDGASHADIERVAVDAIKQTILDGQETISPACLMSAVDRLRDRLSATRPGSQNAVTPARGRKHHKKTTD